MFKEVIMKTRSELREKIMIILYQIDINRKQKLTNQFYKRHNL